jgi:hypothetical protein
MVFNLILFLPLSCLPLRHFVMRIGHQILTTDGARLVQLFTMGRILSLGGPKSNRQLPGPVLKLSIEA